MTPQEFFARFGNRVLIHPVTGCWLWQGCRDHQGYGRVSRRIYREALLHRLALETFSPGELTDEKPLALHNCPGGDRPNCINPRHLWAGTVAENNEDMIRKGRHVAPRGERNGRHTKPERTARGERHASARLTGAQVNDIRRRRGAGESRTVLAREYRVSTAAILAIERGRSWAHLGPTGPSAVRFLRRPGAVS
jgi:hypothetical protein